MPQPKDIKLAVARVEQADEGRDTHALPVSHDQPRSQRFENTGSLQNAPNNWRQWERTESRRPNDFQFPAFLS